MYLKIGDTVKAGTFILITEGEYSDYGVIGLFRAKIDFVVPSRPDRYTGKTVEVDIEAVTTNLAAVDEIKYAVLHSQQD